MGYFDGLTSVGFKKREDGKTVFYPYGILGCGYIVPQENESKIKKFLMKYYTISFVAIIVSLVLFGPLALVLFLILSLAIYAVKIRQLLSGQERIQEKMQYGEGLRNMAASMGVKTSILLLIGAIIMTAGSIFTFFITNNRLMSIFGTVFFGLALLQTIFLVKYSIKSKKRV